MSRPRWLVLVLVLLPLGAMMVRPAGAQTAQPSQSAAQPEPPSTYDRIWQRLTRWYDDPSNPVVQRVLFSGRFHHDFATIDADQGDHDEWNTRRLRLGPRITLLRTFTVHGEVELNPQEHDPLYVRLTDMYVQWSRSGRLAITAGKQSVPFTVDGSTSSRELLTIDRNNLANNIWFPQEYLPGIAVSGRPAPWVYRGGVYSAGAADRELGDFSGGVAALAVLGYDFGPRLGTGEALLSGNYVYQQPDADNTFTRQLEHIASLNFRLDTGRWGLRADVATAQGYLGQSDLWGVTTMPYVNVTEKLQLVARHTFLESDQINGVRLGTYESRIVDGRGDRYQELYVGASYYLYGHRLKVQSGLQYADMADRAGDGGAYSGVSWTTGLRVGW
jgi:phosphate-selective porin OprO and OprP